MWKKVELLCIKETESGAEGLGLQRGWSRKGAEPPVASPTPKPVLKTGTGAGVEQSELRPWQLHGSRPRSMRESRPGAPLPPRPRRPAPRRQVSGALGKEAGGKGGKRK